jgi:hypothetical protein
MMGVPSGSVLGCAVDLQALIEDDAELDHPEKTSRRIEKCWNYH